MKQTKSITVGVDATNLRSGGGVTHLVELLRSAQPKLHGIERVIVWGGLATLSLLEDRPWLCKVSPAELNKNLLRRTFWQVLSLSSAARACGCDVLFVPGGSYAGSFQPVVTMSRNLLPFETHELLRYKWTMFTLKLMLLRLTQTRSYRQTDGLIFLTSYARKVVLQVAGKVRAQTCIIAHGLNTRFRIAPKAQRNINEFDEKCPYRVLYVSKIDQYKHQWHVVEAVSTLRKQGLPIVLDLVGPAYPPALLRLNQILTKLDPERRWAYYHGAIAFEDLHLRYTDADLGLFASSCENMPNILLEAMASGLPIACSNRGPMPEVLGDAGLYFDPEQSCDIARALYELICSPQLRADLAQASFERSQQYSWDLCASDTFEFIGHVARRKTLNIYE